MASLKSWVKELKSALYDPWSSDIDTDHPNCPRCGNTMNFYGHDDSDDFDYGEGYWKCNSCGFTITEDDL